VCGAKRHVDAAEVRIVVAALLAAAADAVLVFFPVFSTYFTKIQSGPIAVSDWPSCSRGEAGSHQSAAQSPDSINF
jgi:hypothetical protein